LNALDTSTLAYEFNQQAQHLLEAFAGENSMSINEMNPRTAAPELELR
jgi:hypothetical protein